MVAGCSRAAHARAGGSALRPDFAALRAGLRLGCCALLALLAAGCGPTPREPAAFTAEAQSLVVRLRGIAFQRFVGERLEFEVNAAGGLFEPDRRFAQLQEVETSFHDEQRGDVHLQASAGEFDLDRQNFSMSGDVQGSTPGGERFATQEARYDRERSRILVDSPVTLQSGRVTSRGSGLVLDLRSRELTLFDMEGRREGGL